jgi:hypothetical protein
VQRFSQQGVSILMTHEIRDLFHAERLSDSAISHLSDNVVLLNYIKEEIDQPGHGSHQVPRKLSRSRHPSIQDRP